MQTDSATPNAGLGLAATVTLLVLSTLGIACLWPGAAAEGREALVVWSCSPEEDVAGYVIHYGPSSRNDPGFSGYPHTVRLELGAFSESRGTAQYRLKGLDGETTYWFAMTAFDHNGNESNFSNEKALSPEREVPHDRELSSGGGGGCQTARSDGAGASCSSGLPAWLLVWLGVPLWILWHQRLTAVAQR